MVQRKRFGTVTEGTQGRFNFKQIQVTSTINFKNSIFYQTNSGNRQSAGWLVSTELLAFCLNFANEKLQEHALQFIQKYFFLNGKLKMVSYR